MKSPPPDAPPGTGAVPDDRTGARIGLISNPLSRRNARGALARTDAIARAHGIPHLHASDEAGMAAALAELAARGTRLVVISGGDGTAQAAFTVLGGPRSPFAQPPDLALLAGGRSNVTPAAAGSAGDPARVLRRLAAAYPQRVRRVDLPLLQATTDDGVLRLGMLVLGGGVVAAVHDCRDFRDRARSPALRGGLGTLAWMVRGVLRGALLPAQAGRVAVDGAPAQPGPWLAVLATTLPRLAPGIRPWWGGAGPLHLTTVQAPARALMRRLPGVLRGRPGPRAVPAAGYASVCPRTVRLELTGPWQLDGEDYPPGVVTLTPGPVLRAVCA